ncbi:MAG: hypothetical protein ACI8R4_002965 [Paracoccaceae bacterium]|jgi:hypothetical protein
MTARPFIRFGGIWAAGLVGSVVAHGGVFALLMVAIRPEPVTEQPMPTSEMEVQAYQMDRTEAQQQLPESQKANQGETSGSALAAGAIPQSRATAAQPAAQRLRADTQSAVPVPASVPDAPAMAPVLPKEPKLQQLRPEPAVVTQSAVPVAVAVAAVLRSQAPVPQIQPVAAVVTSAQPTIATLQVAAPVAAVLTAVVGSDSIPQLIQPTAAPLPAAQPVAAALPQSEPKGDDLAPAAPESQPASSQHLDAALTEPATPSAQKLKAALAFSGGDGDVDPVSVAAFQSFMQPGDIAASGDILRDGVEGLLAQVPCSRLQVGFDPETATLQVNGHIPEGDLRAPVLAALQAQMGADIAVSDNILILPRPQCGALSGIAGVGLPQSTDQNTNPLVIGEDAHARVFTFTQGNLLSLDMTAPEYDAVIYLDYFDAEGNVLHLEPNEHSPLRHATAETVQEIGAKTMQDVGIKLVIGPPYGQEIAVAFAASAPLYDGLRPVQEPAAPYLEWLKAQVAQARADHADFKGEWVYFFVTTSER